MHHKLQRSIWPALLWSVVIFILLTIPGEEFPEGPDIPILDKLIHVFLFGVQVFLWCSYNQRKSSKSLFAKSILIFLASCLFGIGMEYVQKYFVANRGFEYGDIAADIVGSFLGWMAFRSLRARR